jgi:hypothetical protein
VGTFGALTPLPSPSPGGHATPPPEPSWPRETKPARRRSSLTRGASRQYGQQEKTIFEATVMDDVLRVSASEFKARCLVIFRDLEARRIGRVLVTRRAVRSPS